MLPICFTGWTFLNTHFTLLFHTFIQSQLCTLTCAQKNSYNFCHFNINQSKTAKPADTQEYHNSTLNIISVAFGPKHTSDLGVLE